jgi:hypothetical protein
MADVLDLVRQQWLDPTRCCAGCSMRVIGGETFIEDAMGGWQGARPWIEHVGGQTEAPCATSVGAAVKSSLAHEVSVS